VGLVMPLVGGVMIGLASAGLLALNGRIAGITGIAAGVILPVRGDTAWRSSFLAGLVLTGFAASFVAPEAFTGGPTRSGLALLGAGVLVGFGTRLGNGCTSGHGVCGIGRLSPRSLVATCTFIAAGMGTVAAIRAIGGM
jgi:uncharacterized membrane protein YedE/YeeE